MKKTLTVGIPTYSDEQNLPILINSILNQEEDLFRLEKIIIVWDSISGNTINQVRELAIQDKRITIIENKERKGKANALNVIYELNKSDLLFVPDADVVLENENTLNEMVTCFENNPDVNLVSARHVPFSSPKLMAKFAIYSYLSLEDAFMHYNNGNNFYSVMSASMLSKQFADSFRYPLGTLSDQNYVYAQATRNNHNGYVFAKNAHVVFTTVTTFNDWRLLGLRSVKGDKQDVAKYFGEEILNEYSLPKSVILKTQFKWFLKNPFYMIGSVFMNVFIRLFPYKKYNPEDGKWLESKSSKIRIKL